MWKVDIDKIYLSNRKSFLVIILGSLAQILDATIKGDKSYQIKGIASLAMATKDDISFFHNEKYKSQLLSTNAGVIIVKRGFNWPGDDPPILLEVDDVYQSLAILNHHFQQNEKRSGRARTAIIDPGATIAESAYIDHHVIIEEGVSIGNNSIVLGQVFVGKGTLIGDNCMIYPGVKIYHNSVIGSNVIIHSNAVIGSDGFGFAPTKEGSYVKIPQLGRVVIEDNVEVGACTIIDRGTIEDTVIKSGAKLDNLIQIAHNVSVGSNTVIAAQSGISGSTSIGSQCRIGGQVGFAGHITIADRSSFQAQSGVASSITSEGGAYFGYPAIKYRDYLKSYAYFKRLPELAHEIETLKQQLSKEQ